MRRGATPPPLTSLGLNGPEERLYARLLPLSGLDAKAVATSLGLADSADSADGVTGALEAALLPLSRLHLAEVRDGRLHVLPLADAVAALLRRESESAARAQSRLERLSAAIPLMVAAAARPGAGDVDDVHPIDGELTSGGDVLRLLTNIIAESRGDLLWLRPEAWRLPRESAMVEVISEAVASGRRSRAIYPVVAMREAPDVLRARAEAGEQVRLLSDLPTRMMVIGTTHAVVPEPLGYAEEPRLLVRQRALVEALTLLFELLWDRAAPVPELEAGDPRRDLRRFVLQMLAAGQKDEQIARSLGLSLRTVRRRVADLMADLGSDSRFQAGVEAARRGWL
jgi:DNA-binding CsgD family transcriptional regulator